MPSRMSRVCPECEGDDIVLSGYAEADSMAALLCKTCGYSGSVFPEAEEPAVRERPVRAPARVSKPAKRKSKK